MKNTLFKFKLLYVKYFLKSRGTCTSSVKYLKNSFLGNKIWDFERSKNLRIINLRLFCSTGKTADSLTQASNENKNENTIIYMGALTYQVKGVKAFSCMTSVGGLAVQPLLAYNVMSELSLPLGVALWCCVGFFTYVTPFIIHFITKKYVTEIWYNSATETYTAILLSFFLRRIEIKFKIEDVFVPDVLPLFSTMYIKDKPVLIVSDCFFNQEHYIKMMKYDKPLDLGLYFGNASHKSKKNEKSETV